LRAELNEEQVEKILDKYTIGKVAFTMKAYKEIVPNMSAEVEAQILAYLKQAREEAIDYKNMELISGIFEIYKTKCELHLYQNDYNWKKIYKEYVDGLKKKKQAGKK
jgi:phage FluMu gp28-like protein